MGSGTASAYTTTYSYDGANRLLSSTTGSSTQTYTYDDNGNLLTELDATNTAVVSHSYDGLNRLISSAVGTTNITYTYNAQGIRTSRTVGTTTTEYLLDGGNVVGEVTEDTTATYLRGLNLISDGTNYYLYNAHGDVTMLANAIGTVTKSYSCDAFGNQLNTDTTDTNPFRYCGEYYDAETGNYYLRARYYDPGVGRFTQQDTHWNTANMIYGDSGQTLIPQILAIKQAGNLYAYCANDPASFSDYSGNAAKAVTVRYDDNKSTALHIDVFGVMASSGLALVLNELLADDPPIFYAKKGTKGASNSKSAVAMGGASPASPPPNRNQNRRDYFLNKAKNSKLKSIIDQLYRKDAKIGDGGTADMLRHEYMSGKPLDHLQKATDRIVQLTRLLYLEQLVDSDTKLVYQLLADLYDAIKYVRGGK